MKENSSISGIDRDNVINDHLDQDNHHTFEIEDLKKLILAVSILLLLLLSPL